MNVKIVIDTKDHLSIIFDQNSYLVDFTIDTQSLFIHMPLGHWSFNTYKCHWLEGLKRIKDKDASCLLLQVDCGESEFEIFGYFFYKNNSKVLMQRNRFCNSDFPHIKKNFNITTNNCYQLIPEYKKYYPIYGDINQVCWELSRKQFKNLKLRITTEKIRKVVVYDCVRAKISFEGFSQLVNMPIVHWSVDDYKKQWEKGISRLKKHDSSCLITRVVGKPYPMVERWLLYKRDNKIIVYFDYLISLDYQDEIGDNIITLKNCYDFISSEQKHLKKYRVDEWEFDISDFDEIDIEYVDIVDQK